MGTQFLISTTSKLLPKCNKYSSVDYVSSNKESLYLLRLVIKKKTVHPSRSFQPIESCTSSVTFIVRLNSSSWVLITISVQNSGVWHRWPPHTSKVLLECFRKSMSGAVPCIVGTLCRPCGNGRTTTRGEENGPRDAICRIEI